MTSTAKNTLPARAAEKSSVAAMIVAEKKKTAALKNIALVTPDTEAHAPALRVITQNREVMQWVANGRTWDDCKLIKFFSYCKDEESQGVEERQNYYHVVVESGRCIGVVGIHPVVYDERARGSGTPFLTIFLSAGVAGRGIGTKVIGEALSSYWTHHPHKRVIVDVLQSNRPMLKIAKKMRFTARADVRIAGELYNRFEVARR